jgi:hypothetical protein
MSARSSTKLSTEVKADLVETYREIMWLAKRNKITPSQARAWYTHIRYTTLRRQVRIFTGKVSKRSLLPSSDRLVLEHYKRIQTTLTKLVERHLQTGMNNPEEFVEIIQKYERVNIVTNEENAAIMRAGGSYKKADVTLVHWNTLPETKKLDLWNRALRGKVTNSLKYKPIK